jgi:hypothetical protein
MKVCRGIPKVNPTRMLFIPQILFVFPLLVFSACRNESYYGPYQLDIPTDLMERSSYRTFQVPLGDELANRTRLLEECEADQPQREVPCPCDFPILMISERQSRIDYRLFHTQTDAANLAVWVGVPMESDQADLEVHPDLFRTNILAEHVHLLGINGFQDGFFTEQEMAEARRAWSAEAYPTCTGELDRRPAPTELQIGLSLLDDSENSVFMEFTIRIRETK